MDWPATYRVREIRGRRHDLTGVRDVELKKHTMLEVSGRGIGSLRGIERFDGLTWLRLANLVEPDLGLFVGLNELEHLELAALQGDVDYRPLERLKELRSLSLSPQTPAAARRMLASLDLGQLPGLEDLHLGLDRPQCPISLAFLDALPSLEKLTLIDFVIEDDQLERLTARSEPLHELTLTARDGEEAQRFCEAMKNHSPLLQGFHVYEQFMYFDDRPALRVDARRAGHVLSADMATEWGLGDNITAEAHLRRLLIDAQPDLERRVTWASDIGEIIAWADRAQPLRELEVFIADQPSRHQFSVSSRALRRQRRAAE